MSKSQELENQPLSQEEWGRWREVFETVHLLSKDERHQSSRCSDNSYSFMGERDFGLWMLTYHPPVWTDYDRAYMRWDGREAEDRAPLQLMWSYNDGRLDKLSVYVESPASEKRAYFDWNGSVKNAEEIILDVLDPGPWNGFLRAQLNEIESRLKLGQEWMDAAQAQEAIDEAFKLEREHAKELQRAKEAFNAQSLKREKDLKLATDLFRA